MSQLEKTIEEQKMDVPNTRNQLMKRNRCQALANAFKKSTNTGLSYGAGYCR